MCFFGRLLPLCCGALLAALAGAPPASAHAFGARYDLPLPLEYYLAAAGAAVALSFVMMSIAFDSRAARADIAWIDLSSIGLGRLMAHPAMVAVIKILSVAVFILVVAAGLWGNQDPVRNFAPTFIWVTWWVGLAYVAALIGDVWPAINPWSNVYDGVERLARLVGWRGRLSLELAYPR